MRWSTEIEHVINSMPKLDYAWTVEAKHGCSKDVYWGDTKIMRAGNPPKYYCCGFMFEVFIETLKRFPVAKDITAEQIKDLLPYAFLYTDRDEYLDLGLPGRLIQLGWATEILHPKNVDYGDIAQIWWDKQADKEAGHSVITTHMEKMDDIPRIWTISAKSKPKPGGIVKDWYTWHIHRREWKIARLKQEFLEPHREGLAEKVEKLESRVKVLETKSI